MASLDDTLTRLAPKAVEGLDVEWCLDGAGTWLEVAGWFSPGLKLGEPKYQVAFKKVIVKTGDASADIRAGIDDVLAQLAERLRPIVPRAVSAEPIKRRGRPPGSKNKPKSKKRAR
jgi:hypothetical protein